MFGFVGQAKPPAAASAADAAASQRRLARWFYRGTMALAGLIALLVVLAPMFPRPQYEPGFKQLWLLIATDATLKKALVVGAVGLWLTALLFFRAPAEPEPASA